MCGADQINPASDGGYGGSPPRVRSRLQLLQSDVPGPGITSACAEQTVMGMSLDLAGGDHLRVCGADFNDIGSWFGAKGSPPRVRSRRSRERPPVREGRITSACAEQTSIGITLKTAMEDHLRVCGADGMSGLVIRKNMGSPPRVRSRPAKLAPGVIPTGITSACAEQTRATSLTRMVTRNHLRVCGADPVRINGASAILGSPPRVRSRHLRQVERAGRMGITSACAEQTVVFYCVLSQLNGVEYLIYALRRVS